MYLIFPPGQLSPVCRMRGEGLQYLGLAGCRLAQPELAELAASRHTASLLQLDLADNPCQDSLEAFQAYVGLFEALEQVGVRF